MSGRLEHQDVDFLRLIARSPKDGDGWAPVGARLYRIFFTNGRLHPDLVEHEPVGDEGRGRTRLTAAGQSLICAMDDDLHYKGDERTGPADRRVAALAPLHVVRFYGDDNYESIAEVYIRDSATFKTDERKDGAN